MVQGMLAQSPTPFSWQQPCSLKDHTLSCSSSPRGGSLKGIERGACDPGQTNWTCFPGRLHLSITLENRWKPLRLRFFKVTVKRTHCEWVSDSSLELFQLLSFQRLEDSVIPWNLWAIQNPSYKVLICLNQKAGLCCWQPICPNMGREVLTFM